MPQILELHVDKALSQDPFTAPFMILRSLHEKLRNSLYVSQILGPESIEGSTLERAMSSLLPDLYKKALGNAGWQLAS